ncbi:cytochrome d ubiquinol oxidase subunit II [Phytoactinopolyspora halotolerans]|uniref:Cytochrome d ubiquinol oxidase subunit II n=1 Tax=Phytoactinopolyspora halotolerans TaxID=1981512 RepID=A0A6L9S1D0_9ACTN|nr:cytochrome d ubiquinol oxidase subunit II [Phytoactinopolyspora halotolerans]NED98806.1 cytochrome d ubiquinol oxidase subunit II [Phytoactinopolyspora halotolerans]
MVPSFLRRRPPGPVCRAGHAGGRPGAGRWQLFVVLITMLLAPVLLAAPAIASDQPEQPAGTDQPRVVFAGVAGLAWEDVTAEDMPTLHGLAGTDAAASLTARTIRSRTCAVDGWLTVGAGRRATDVVDSDGDGSADRYCRPAPTPSRGEQGGATVPGWQQYVAEQENHAYGAVPGLLGERLNEHGLCGTAVGPGAALALADESGRVGSYYPNAAEVNRDLMHDCPVTVVDLGALPPPAAAGSDESARQSALEERRQVARGIDELIHQILDRLPANTALIIAGVSDSGPTAIPLHNDPTRVASSALRVAVAHGPTADGDEYGPRWLTSGSTQWSGIVQLTDVASTLLDYAGLEEPTEGSVGRPFQTAGQHPAAATDTVDKLLSNNTAAQIYRTQSGPFFQLLGVAQLVFFGLALLWIRLRPAERSPVLRLVRAGAITVASFPVASFLANAFDWARFDRPAIALWTIITLLTAVVAAVALGGPWRRHAYGPAGVVGGITAGVMALDVSTGSHLQQLSLLGLSPVVAGRFYGLGNIPFAIFIVACLVAAGALAQWLIDRGTSRRAAGATTVAIGLAATVVVGSPQAGADVGGILAAIPAFTVLAIGVLGVRLTVTKVVGAGVAALGVFLAVAWLDWQRPAGSRTHFGAFFEDLVSGEAWSVVWRKFEASLGTLDRLPYYAWTVPIAYALILWLTLRPPISGLREALRSWPTMTYVVWSALLAGAAGFAANDSGIIIPALLLTVGVPLVVSAIAAASRADGETDRPEELAGVSGTAT